MLECQQLLNSIARGKHINVCVDVLLYCTLTIYTIILLKSVAVSQLQVAILARLSLEMSQTVRIDWQYILSLVRVSVRSSNFFYTKNTKAIAKTRKCLLNAPVTVGRSPATT